MKKTIELEKSVSTFQCPICKTGFHIESDQSFRCENRHCFDLSAKGYVNFITNQKKNIYDKELFAARRRVFAAGFYDLAAEAVKQAILDHIAEDKKTCFLDAGCGEGFYADFMVSDSQFDGYALDVVKDAVQLAARKNTNVKWMVADLSNIPLQDDSLNVILNILTPANYKEFGRILVPGGLVVKVIPGKEYLKEVRNSIKTQLSYKEQNEEATISHMKENLDLIDHRKVTSTFPITPEQRLDFLKMTPMTFHADTSKADFFTEITIDLELLVGRIH